MFYGKKRMVFVDKILNTLAKITRQKGVELLVLLTSYANNETKGHTLFLTGLTIRKSS